MSLEVAHLYITQLELTHFRSARHTVLEPAEGLTVLTGDNGQGKTTLLEALYLCCTGRSHRTSRDKELVGWGEPHARLSVELSSRLGRTQIQMLLPANSRKQILINGKRAARVGELMGHLRCVLFSPEDLHLVQDGPDTRRRFLDMELSQLRPAYFYCLQRYSRALEQRNNLLKEIRLKPALAQTLPAWDEQLIHDGLQIVRHREAFIKKLSALARQNHLDITQGLEALECAYQSQLLEVADAEGYRAALEKSRKEDLRRAVTLVGPHRDELDLTLADKPLRAYGSQGQQRTAALALKLSELSLMQEEIGEPPLLMLDDVMSELDPSRRRILLERMKGVQTLVTCTDVRDLAGAPAAKTFVVKGGEIAGEATSPLQG